MSAILDYKKLSARRSLEEQILNLNAAREKVLKDLNNLGVAVDFEKVVAGGRIDAATLEHDEKLIERLQEENYHAMLERQVNDVIAQAREGSKFVRLERKLAVNPEFLMEMNLTPLQEEQINYQKKQLEVFDYLVKHFSQFEQLGEMNNLPESGEKFFQNVVTVLVGQMSELVAAARDLRGQINRESKLLAKLKRREQRELELIHAQVGKNLTDDEIGSPALLEQNAAYQDLLAKIRSCQALKTSLLNQLNNLFDQGIQSLTDLREQLTSIVGQNQTTREILFALKNDQTERSLHELIVHIKDRLDDFDRNIAQILVSELGRKFDEGTMDAKRRRAFGEVVEEVLEFQEYLGQIMSDSRQVISSNLDDLENARAKFGRLVLDFYQK